MSAVTSISVAYDARYLTRQVGQGAENYYLSAISEHGEPPGIWTGYGCEELNLAVGSEVEGRTLEDMVAYFVDPRDPNCGDPDVPADEKQKLGRPARNYKTAQDLYEAALAAEPEATAERRRELWIDAKKSGRQAVKGLDATFSVDKSTTVLHAALQVKAQQALAAGNLSEAAVYQRYAEIVWDGIMVGNQAMLDVMQAEAGQSRAGYHGKKVAGRTTGRYVDAPKWVIASFRQHTSRENDPQLHVHNLVLNRVKTADGEWRTLDSRAIHKTRAWAGAVGERAMEEYLTAKLGVEWRTRPDGKGREIVVVDQAVKDLFSTRCVQVTDAVQALIEEYKARHGKEPSPRAIFSMAQFATKDTKARKAKLAECPTRAEQLAAWEKQSRSAELGSLADIPDEVLGRISRDQLDAIAAATYDVKAVLAAAVAEVAEKRAVWDRSQLIAAIGRHLPDGLGGLDGEHLRRLLDDLADEALAPGRQVERLNVAPAVTPPEQLTREDGSSIYQPRHCERYATSDQLDREMGLLDAARAGGAPALAADHAAKALGVRAAPASAEQHTAVAEAGRASGQPTPELAARDASASRTRVASPSLVPSGDAPTHGLSLEQASVVYGIATSGRQIDVLVGPAGAGKSRTMGALARVWTDGTGRRVIGLTTAEKAARVLAGADSGDGDAKVEVAYNIKAFFQARKAGKPDAQIRSGDLLIVDEASMVPTADLSRLRRLAEQHGAKLLLTGDPEQLDAPEAGGMMRHLVDQVGAHELTEVRRMAEPWERDASLGVRAGDLAALEEYDRRGRLEEGSREEMEAAAYQGWLADYLAGHESLLMAPTNAKAAELGIQARADLVRLGIVDDSNAVEVERGEVMLRFGRGDLIQARQNNHRITDRTGTWVANRDVLRVTGPALNGGLKVKRIDGTGGEWVLPPTYVEENVEHAYAGTVHMAQGRTVDTCHGLVDEAMYRQQMYVMLSRGRQRNVAYVVTNRANVADLAPAADASPKGPDEEARDRWDVLAKVVNREGGDPTALEALREETEHATHLGNLGPMWVDLVREHAGRRYQHRLRELLGPELYARYETEDADSPLVRQLRAAELAGYDVDELLTEAVRQRALDDPSDPVDSVGKVLYYRIEKLIGTAEPAVVTTWTERTPEIADPQIGPYVQRLAEAMDERTSALGELVVENPPEWAVEHLGPVPEDPIERAVWAHRAGIVAGYREQFRPEEAAEHEALGPAPSRANPEARAAWMAAYTALGRPEAEQDLAAAGDGELWVTRARYQREAEWAPPYVGDQLRTASIAQRHFEGAAARLAAAAKAAKDPDVRVGLEARARKQQRLADEAAQRVATLTDVDDARCRWHAATEDARLAAQRADGELRRRLQKRGEPVDFPPLHGIGVASTEPRQVEREDATPVVDGQLELDLGRAVTPPAKRPRATAEDVLYMRYAMRRAAGDPPLSLAVIADELGIERYEVAAYTQKWAERYERTVTREQQQRPRHEVETPTATTVEPETVTVTPVIDGQLELDLGLAPDAQQRGEDVDLRTAVEQARHARRVLASRERQAEQQRVREAEEAEQEAQAERVRVARTTAQRRAGQVEKQQREAEPASAQTSRQPTAGDTARADFPHGGTRPRRAQHQAPQITPPQPGQQPGQGPRL